MKTITNAQSIFREDDKEGDDNEDYGTLRELSDQDLIDDILGSGTKQGYLFFVKSGGNYEWAAVAHPAVPGESGDRYFYTNHEGVTYYTTSGEFDLELTVPEGAQPVGK